jgi:hypothetical protein
MTKSCKSVSNFSLMMFLLSITPFIIPQSFEITLEAYTSGTFITLMDCR